MRERSDFTFDPQTPSLLTERRKHIRIQLHIQARISGHNQIWNDASIIDISGTGAQILTEDIDLLSDDLLTVSFRLGTSYQLSAIIIWHRQTEHRRHLMGIKWASLVNPEQEQLTREILRIAVNRRRLKR